jgi:hypothetical protein
MKKVITILIFAFTLSSCTTISEKMPTRKSCDGSKATLADVFCKKAE